MDLQNEIPKERYSSFYKRKYYDYMFEQYKLYVQTAEDVSKKRQQSNNFFIGINTALIGFLGYFNYYRASNNTDESWIVLLFLLGIVISFIWGSMIRSYRKLNSGKYEVINDIEKKMPLNLFSKEQEILREIKYLSFTEIEVWIPRVCAGLYASLLIYFILNNPKMVELIPFIEWAC